MPLAWAHAEYVKLLRSLEENKVWDMPPQTVERYQVQQMVSPCEVWTEHAPTRWVTEGKHLRMDLDQPARIILKVDGGAESSVTTDPPILLLHSALVTLPPAWKIMLVVVEQGVTRTLRLMSRHG